MDISYLIEEFFIISPWIWTYLYKKCTTDLIQLKLNYSELREYTASLPMVFSGLEEFSKASVSMLLGQDNPVLAEGRVSSYDFIPNYFSAYTSVC